MAKYYRILHDPTATARWFLKAPHDAMGNEIDARLFTYGTRYTGDTPLVVPLRHQGDQVDLNFAAFDMIVTPAKINAEIERQFDIKVQRIPVEVGSNDHKYEILNILEVVKCIDEENSKFMKWTEDDGRPDKVGKYRMITELRIDSKAAEGHHLFRIDEWKSALIASEDMKVYLEERSVTGITFQPVN